MSKDKDKDLDNLFKKRLDDPVDPIGFDEKDWDAMEQMLDKQKRRGIIYWLPVMSSVAALFLLFLGWWLLRPATQNIIPKNPLQAVSHNKHAKTDTLNNNKQQPAVKNAPLNKQLDEQQIAKNKPVESDKTTSSASYLATNHKTKHVKKDIFNSGYDINNSNITAPVLASAGRHKNTVNPVNGVTTEDTARQHVELLAASGNDLNINETTITTEPIKNTEIPKSVYKRVASESANGKIISAEKQGFRPQYAISVLAAPDINGVGSFAESKVGTNIGLLFSAGVSKKFTISTGALYSVKPYMTGIENYHTGYTFQTNPLSVLADCRMLDIPLNIGYQLYNKHQNKFSVGTGLSSYIMLHESYTFNYASATTTGPEYFNVAHSSGYFFGIVNLNATYQRQLNSKVGFSVMPYLKLPLTNIGYSQVRLQTTGVAVGLSWNLNSLSR
jgi:hypothetical protein